MKQDQDSLKKVRIITYAVTALLAVVMAVGSVAFATYQRNQKREQQKQAQMAAALQKQQLANVEAIKATLPLFRETAKGENKIMVKVRQEDLPATITPDNITPSPTASQYVFAWSITKGGGAIADNSTPNGWSVSADFSIAIPAGATYGLYDITYTMDDHDNPGDLEGASAQFKIVPPCPTSVTLTHSP